MGKTNVLGVLGRKLLELKRREPPPKNLGLAKLVFVGAKRLHATKEGEIDALPRVFDHLAANHEILTSSMLLESLRGQGLKAEASQVNRAMITARNLEMTRQIFRKWRK